MKVHSPRLLKALHCSVRKEVVVLLKVVEIIDVNQQVMVIQAENTMKININLRRLRNHSLYVKFLATRDIPKINASKLKDICRMEFKEKSWKFKFLF